MFLYELAMELDERSTDLAEKAAALGLAGLTPTTSLTPDQVATLRQRFGATSGPSAEPAPATGAAGGPPAPEAGRVARRRRGSGVQVAVVAVALVLVGALFAYMVANTSTDEERKAEVAARSEAARQRAAAAEEPAEPDGEVADEVAFCQGHDLLLPFATAFAEQEGTPLDYVGMRRIALDEEANVAKAVLFLSAGTGQELEPHVAVLSRQMDQLVRMFVENETVAEYAADQPHVATPEESASIDRALGELRSRCA